MADRKVLSYTGCGFITFFSFFFQPWLMAEDMAEPTNVSHVFIFFFIFFL